jgi:hypothetical protein
MGAHRLTAKTNLQFQRFGRLVVLSQDERSKHGGRQWRCGCDCGATTVVRADSLKSGATTSCGCYNKDVCTTHGQTKTRAYKAWQAMKTRIAGGNEKYRRNYVDRGISMCDRWESFENFYADMGDCPDGLTLERIDNDGDYEPSNCKWADYYEQNKNRRPSGQDAIR